MTKSILITGATDGIGLLTAKKLAESGHRVLLHGRNPEKLARAAEQVGGAPETFVADLSNRSEVVSLGQQVLERHDRLDVLINNAGILKAPNPVLENGLDIRFMVNTFAPYLLTQQLLPILPKEGRIVNLSSAAQAPVDPTAVLGGVALGDMEAYAQSKLAITVWTQEMAKTLPEGPQVIAVNPGSLLASKMVKEGFGVSGHDLSIGADILIEAATGARFAQASGQYFDNDSGRFAAPHSAAQDAAHVASLMQAIRTYETEYR